MSVVTWFQALLQMLESLVNTESYITNVFFNLYVYLLYALI